MYLNAWIFLTISGIGILKYCYNYFTDNKNGKQKN